MPESDIWHAAAARPRHRDASWGAAGTLSVFVRCFVLTILNMSNYWFTITWLPRYLQVERGLSLARSGWATLCFVVGSLIGYLLFGFAADVLRAPHRVHPVLRLLAAGRAGFTVPGRSSPGGRELVLLFLFVAGLGTGTWSQLRADDVSELFPTRVRGIAMSMIMNSTRGVQFLAPVVIAPSRRAGAWRAASRSPPASRSLAAAWIWTLPETRGRAITAGAPLVSPAR